MLRHQFLGTEQRVPQRQIPVVTRSSSDYERGPASALRATWIGHASTLVEIDGRRVLTDPIWSTRCSPSTWVGPKRFHPPPLSLAELPNIDIAVISHDHFDHLDMATVEALAARGTRFVVPLGVGAHLEVWGLSAAQSATARIAGGLVKAPRGGLHGLKGATRPICVMKGTQVPQVEVALAVSLPLLVRGCMREPLPRPAQRC